MNKSAAQPEHEFVIDEISLLIVMPDVGHDARDHRYREVQRMRKALPALAHQWLVEGGVHDGVIVRDHSFLTH